MGTNPGPGSDPGSQSRDAAHLGSEVIELLEMFWEQGREAGHAGAVSPSQLRVLYTLDRDEGINLRMLSDALGSAPPSVSRLCDRLQAMGFVERAPSPVSRRELNLRLTRHGKTYLADLRARRENVLMSTIDAMPAAARQALLDGLDGFRSAAAAGPDEIGGPGIWPSTA
ncbi:MarR family winged helix-turn-helix transcriptional regulator [Streptomyces sp. NPDC059398]|uniref:MarR family winged helix-turn-helix transcriptional regulator n=1 Tax=Streptomyces sp. NPDC059398 TaxID=3346820 RepID=UPI0036904A04